VGDSPTTKGEKGRPRHNLRTGKTKECNIFGFPTGGKRRRKKKGGKISQHNKNVGGRRGVSSISPRVLKGRERKEVIRPAGFPEREKKGRGRDFVPREEKKRDDFSSVRKAGEGTKPWPPPGRKRKGGGGGGEVICLT